MMTYTLEEICQVIALDKTLVVKFIEREWVHPVEVNAQHFDEGDLSRIQLIHDLQSNFEVNDEGIDLILHLLDQLNSTHRLLKQLPG